METNFPLDEKLSKNDLIEYVITSKVLEIEQKINEQKTKLEKTENELNPAIKQLEKDFSKLKINLVEAFVKKLYSDTISTIEKNFKCKHTIILGFLDHDNHNHANEELAHFLGVRKNEALIIFPFEDPTKEEKSFRGGWHQRPYGDHPMHPMFFIRNINSIIRVDISDAIVSLELDEIKGKIESNKEKIEIEKQLIQVLRKEIDDIRSKKDVIKNKLIEETLSRTDNGKALLNSLKTIDFNTTKLLA